MIEFKGDWWGGGWSQALLRVWSSWQVKYQSVNDSYDVWSSFLYLPYSCQYIQHIECRVRNSVESFPLCLKRYHLLSIWTQLPLFRNSFLILQFTTTSGPSIRCFKKNVYIYIYAPVDSADNHAKLMWRLSRNFGKFNLLDPRGLCHACIGITLPYMVALKPLGLRGSILIWNLWTQQLYLLIIWNVRSVFLLH
jgi:hypothetical protein